MRNTVSITLFYLLVFLTPFLFVQNTNELFEFPKMYFVYLTGTAFSVVTVVGWLWKKGSYRAARPDLPTLRLPLLAGLFAGSFAVSTLFSSHSYTSLWGYYSRFNGGLISVSVCFGAFLATRRAKPSLRTTLRTVSLTLIPISIYAFMQHFGLRSNWSLDTSVRAFSTFGQPNWFAAYCSMVLPIPLYLALEEKIPPANKLGWLALFILGFGGFWFSYSVSGIIGLASSLLLFGLLNTRALIKNLRPVLLTTLACLVFAFLNPGIFGQKISDALVDFRQIAKPLARLPALSDPEKGMPDNGPAAYSVTDSGFIRTGIWKGTVHLWLSSTKIFLIGSGPETFPYEFQKFRPASLNHSSEWNYILNKPHNYYLELLAQNGIVGLILYLALVIATVKRKHPILSPALSGLYATNIFGWPTVSTSLLFWIFLAFLHGSGLAEEERPSGRSRGTSFASLAGPVILTGIVFALYSYLNVIFVKQYLSDAASKSAERHFETGDLDKALWMSKKSIKLNPYEPYYYRQRAKIKIPMIIGQSAEGAASTRASALKDLLRAVELNPSNHATLRGEVPLYFFLIQEEIPAIGTQDPFYQTLADNYYANLVDEWSNDAGILALVAKYQKLSGFTADYNRTAGRIYELRPDLLNWYLK